MIIGIGPSQEMQIPALIVKITDTEVILDLNHPLAGKNLNFEIKVLDVQESNNCECGDECTCDHNSHESLEDLSEEHNHNHECKCKEKQKNTKVNKTNSKKSK